MLSLIESCSISPSIEQRMKFVQASGGDENKGEGYRAVSLAMMIKTQVLFAAPFPFTPIRK